MMLLKRALVTGLERLDTVLDSVPGASLSHDPEGRTVTLVLYRYGHWGCLLNLSSYSCTLDDHWKTGVWT